MVQLAAAWMEVARMAAVWPEAAWLEVVWLEAAWPEVVWPEAVQLAAARTGAARTEAARLAAVWPEVAQLKAARTEAARLVAVARSLVVAALPLVGEVQHQAAWRGDQVAVPVEARAAEAGLAPGSTPRTSWDRTWPIAGCRIRGPSALGSW